MLLLAILCAPLQSVAQAPDTRIDPSADEVDAGGSDASAEPTPGAGDDGGEEYEVIELSPGELGDVEELIVTGTRTVGPPVDEATSVQAFSAGEIEAQGFSDIRDISAFTPNLEIKSSFAASNPTLFIRGVGLNDFNANSASSVAVYVDDVYMNSPAGQLGQIFDLEKIDVLRGPQGGMYGRNASAGAIRLSSRKPTGLVASDGSLTYGAFNQVIAQGAIELPIVEDSLGIRIAGKYEQRDGTTENRCGAFAGAPSSAGCDGRAFAPLTPLRPDTRGDVNNRKNWAARTILRWEPGEMDWLFNIHGGQNRGGATQFQHVGTLQTYGGTDALFYADRDRDPFAGDYNRTGLEALDLMGASASGEIPVGSSYVVRTITAWERNARKVEEDSDASPNRLIETDWTNRAWQASQDLRLKSDYGGDFEWNVGAFYLYEDLSVKNTYHTRTPRIFRQQFQQKTHAFAAYGGARWTILEDLELEGGVRVNYEKKDFAIQTLRANTQNPNFSPEIADETGGSWTEPTGDIKLTWFVTEDATVYGKYSHGFKPGHFNGGAVFRDQIVEPVQPETVDAVEVGLKAAWLDRRIEATAAAFYYDYNDLQVFQLEAGLEFPVQQLINANDARVMGVEADLRVTPIEGLEIYTNFGWLDSRYLDFQNTINVPVQNPNPPPRRLDVPTVLDFSGNPLVASPRFSFSGTVTYDIPIGSTGRFGTIQPRYDFAFKDDVYFDPSKGVGINPFKQFPPFALGQEAFWLHNFRLAWRSEYETVEVAFFVRNAFDQTYKTDAFDLSRNFELLLEVYGEPRTFGGVVTVKWSL